MIVTEIISPYRIPVFNALAREQGIDLHLIFLAETDPSQRQWLVYKDEIRFSYEVLRSWRRRLGKYNFLLNWGLGAALRGASPDVILCGGYSYLASWECLGWARRKRVPFLIWVESTAQDLRRGHASIEFLKMKFMRCCQAFVVAGKSSFDYVRSFGASEAVIFTAPDAVDNVFFAAGAEAARRDPSTNRQALDLPNRYFLFVGRLVPQKGVFDLLQAYATLAPDLRSELSLLFVGDGPARRELQERAAAIFPGSVRFAGFAQREQLASYYGLAEVFVFPTYTDPWGLVVNEAMACGLPIISTSTAGCAADLVEDHWNGRVVPAGDTGHLAAAMDQLAHRTELRSRMGERSRERIQQYSPEAWAASIADAVFSCGVPSHV